MSFVDGGAIAGRPSALSSAADVGVAEAASPGHDMRCTLTTGGGGPETSPSPLTSTGAASPLCDRERREPPLSSAFAAAAGMNRSADLTLLPVLRRRAASLAFRLAARAASSAGSTSCGATILR